MRYRSEIDGLRAVAVAPVILFHAGFDIFSGGYVGVDIFFVISGYLITTIILSEKEQGTFSLISFYERRARRILPALFLVMLVSLLLAWVWLPPSDMKDFSQSLVAVSVFASNVFFWQETGYWETASELKPLLHTWTLAVEEQYYIVFPLFLMMMWRFRKRWIISTFTVGALISLAAAHWGSYEFPSANFFLLPTRSWELAIGAAIAFYFLYRKTEMRTFLSHKAVNEGLACLGLLMISYAIFAFDETVPFPSLYALVPTVGAGLIIVFASSETIIGKLLSTKPFVGIGLISYSAYLWHQPLLAFSRHASLSEASELTLAMMAALSLVLAYLSWRFIEKPFRQKGKINRKMVFLFTISGSIIFVMLGLIGHFYDGFPGRFSVRQSVLNNLEGSKLRASCDRDYDGSGWNKTLCEFGDTSNKGKMEFVVFGDSHSEAILPAFDVAARSLQVRFAHLGLGGCLPLLGVDVALGNFNAGVCKDLASRQYEYVKNNNIKKVFFVGRWSLYTQGEWFDADMTHYFLVDEINTSPTRESSRRVFIDGFENTIHAYQEIGVKIYIVEQIPQQKVDASKLYYKISMFGLDSEEANKLIMSQSVSLENSIKLQAYNRGRFKRLHNLKGDSIVNFDKHFCNEEICLIGNVNHPFYRDDNHLSDFGAKMVAKEITNYIQ